MKITVSGLAIAFEDDLEITDPQRLRGLHGLSYEEELIGTYLDDWLADIGIVGGSLRLIWHDESGQLRVASDFWAPRTLTEQELGALTDATLGQWSDGIGENGCVDVWGIFVDMCPGPPGARDLKVEQVEDGRTVPAPSLLSKAARTGDLEGIRTALANGEAVDTRARGYTPLHLAILYGHSATAIHLIRHGADVNARHIDDTPLMFCATARDMVDLKAAQVAHELLVRWAEVNAQDKAQCTALMYARNRGKKELEQMLIKCGADLSRLDEAQ